MIRRHFPFARVSVKLVAPIALPFALLLAAGVGGCASSGTAGAAAAKPSNGAPVELEGTRWRLPVSEGGIDNRIVEFKKSPEGVYKGSLVDVGQKLAGKVGAYVGAVMMELTPTGKPNQYNGIYRLPSRDPVEATYSVSDDGEELKCSLEERSWVRVH